MLLELRQVSKRFGGLLAVNNVTATIGEGEVLGVIGPNGAGKSTLINLITNYDHADSGRILLEGQDLAGLRPNEVARCGIVRTFQASRPFLNMSTVKNVMIGAFLRTEEVSKAHDRAINALERVGLMSVAAIPPRSLTVQDRKKLELARALATSPRVLLLDEVMAGLTSKEIDETLDTLRRLRDGGMTLLVIEHVMKAVMTISDRIIVLNHGEVIAEGRPVEVSRDPAVIQAYLGQGFHHA